MKLVLTNFSLKHPWVVLVSLLILSALFTIQFPKVRFDNDPENMLSDSEPVRVFHRQVKDKYALYDFVIVGIVNDKHRDGIFNVDTLGKIHRLTSQLLSLTRGEDGKAIIVDGGEKRAVDLSVGGAWRRALSAVFRHDPNRLFDEDGNSAIIGREIISPSVVDSIKQADLGSLKLAYLMEDAPRTREEALEVRDDAMGNPLYRGTLVSEDAKAICIYIPIKDKTYSYNVAALVKRLTDDWQGDDRVLITGQPVAQDTFGIEMLVQMATSAPLAALAIFILLWVFFKRLSLIVAPMIVAFLSVIFAMGLLIGLGFDVHIMSSMIAIFLMPIAVADSVHILSEFFDLYHQFGDKKKTIQHIIGHLFRPMLYTSLTTMAGFGSLMLTPIPPVRVFGGHVAFGVGVAWILTMTLIPAYIMLAVPDSSLKSLGKRSSNTKAERSGLGRILQWLGGFSYSHWKSILVITVIVLVISIVGIAKINVNDNPVKWFIPKHSIRVADEILNRHFGGTYTAYLTFSASRPDVHNCEEKAKIIRKNAEKRFGKILPAATARFIEKLNAKAQLYRNVNSSDLKKCFVEIVNEAEKIDEKALSSWGHLADAINYLEPEGLTFTSLSRSLKGVEGVLQQDVKLLLERLGDKDTLKGGAFQSAALQICDEFTSLSFKEFMFEMEAELTAPLFKRPEMLAYIERLQANLIKNVVVGKTSSAVDALKKASFELTYVAPPSDANESEVEEYAARNELNRSIPSSSAAIGQVFTQLEGMKKKDALFHLITKDYQQMNIWVQLKSGDNTDMEAVVEDVKRLIRDDAPPEKVNIGWAGLTYLNVVWQKRMVNGMLWSLFGSFVIVLLMMMVLFRSPLYGFLAMIPLTVTIAFIYGLIGLVGKDYDMPVAILSALTLGLSVDFAIHFLERAREEQKKAGSWKKARAEMFKEPAMAISRNAITISVGFTPLLVAPLVPYRTVGFFLATIMAVSWLATLFLLPALLTCLKKWAFKGDDGAVGL